MMKLNDNITTAISWKDYENSLPIDDLRSFQKKLAFETGYYPEHIEMGVDVAIVMMRCKRKFGLKSISELNKFLYGDKVNIILDEKPSNGKIILSMRNQRDKFVVATVF